MSLIIKGKINQILQQESGVSRVGNEWKKQEFVVETDEQFPKKVCFTLFNEKSELLQNLSAGDEVEVSFNLESREFNGRWYHNVNAWKIDKVGGQGDAGFPVPPPEYSEEDIPPEQDSHDDLPF